MASKLAFQLSEAGVPNRYSIRLVDRKQIAALAQDQGFRKPIPLEPIVVVYDEGNGELVPVESFDDNTPSGRIAMKIICDTYADALKEIASRHAPGAQSQL